MEVLFVKAVKLGNRSFAKGKQEISDSLFYNMAFKNLIKSGVAQVLPRDVARQKIQTAQDVKALNRAKVARKASFAKKALQSAQGAPSAQPTSSSASGSGQTLPLSMPVIAGAAQSVAPASAQGQEG